MNVFEIIAENYQNLEILNFAEFDEISGVMAQDSELEPNTRAVIDDSIPTPASRDLPSFCQENCSAYLPGWCKAHSRNAYINLDFLACCPRNPERVGLPRYRIIDDGSQTNAAFFGCAPCPSRKIDNGVELCAFDPSFLRRIDTWGWCPRFNADGPIQGWKRGFTSKYSIQIDQEGEDA